MGDKVYKKDLANLFSAKLKFYMDKTGIKPPEISGRLGIAASTVRNWYNRGSMPRDILQISELADILGVSMVDLLPVTHKEKAKIVRKELEANIGEYEEYLSDALPSSLVSVPLVDGYVGAGSTGLLHTDAIDHIYVDIHTLDTRYPAQALRAIQVVGDSMKPYVDDADIVIFTPIREGESAAGDGKYIISTAHGEQVKNLKFMMNGNIRIISENPSYRNSDGYDEEIDKESQEYLTIVGRVVGRILKG